MYNPNYDKTRLPVYCNTLFSGRHKRIKELTFQLVVHNIVNNASCIFQPGYVIEYAEIRHGDLYWRYILLDGILFISIVFICNLIGWAYTRLWRSHRPNNNNVKVCSLEGCDPLAFTTGASGDMQHSVSVYFIDAIDFIIILKIISEDNSLTIEKNNHSTVIYENIELTIMTSCSLFRIRLCSHVWISIQITLATWVRWLFL